MINKKILEKAHNNKYAIPHFNFDSLQMAKFILEECDKLKSPVIVAVSMSAVNYMGGFKVVKNIISSLRDELKIKIPVILHLDHASSVEQCKEAIDNDFDSVMLDLSGKSIDENIKGVQEIKKYNPNIIIECEVGSIGKNGGEDISYADINECIKIVNETKADLLAPAIGTVHGLYKGEQNINIDILKEINEKLNIPLVLHGGSDTKKEILKECISNGISKININTSLKVAWNKGVKEYIENNPEEIDYRKYIKNAEKYIKECIREHVNLFGSSNRE